MNAIEQLYRNLGLVTEDGYVKVNDQLWVKSRPYNEHSWNQADKSTLPTKEELNEIHLKFQEIIQIQESCELDSLKQILDHYCSWAWSSTEEDDFCAWEQRMIDGIQNDLDKDNFDWVVPVRRSL